MNPLLPTIEELASAVDHGERARWLLSCPLSILMKYQDTIRNRLRVAFFADGVAYLEAELAWARAVRVNGFNRGSNPMLAAMWKAASIDPFGPAGTPAHDPEQNVTMPGGEVGVLDI